MNHRFASPFAFIPAPPTQVRDAYALAQYRSLTGQVPIAYAAVITMFLAWMLFPTPHVPLWMGRGILVVLIGLSCLRLVIWLTRSKEQNDPHKAERAMLGSSAISTLLAAISGSWASFCWLHASTSLAPYFPLILTVGLLTPVLAQSASPRAAILNLGVGLTPLIATMLIHGDAPARIAAVLLVVMSAFLINMLCQQRRRFIDLLLLEAQMREEAKTDPLTGLVNSRALADRFSVLVEAARAPQDAPHIEAQPRPALLRVDLDGFKPINERLGHAAGDDVLRQVADRLRGAVGNGTLVCRLSGDDFALIAAVHDGREIADIHASVLAGFDAPFMASGQPVTITASTATALWPQDGRTLAELHDTADKRLAVVKQRERLERTYAVQAASAQSANWQRTPLQAVRNA